MNLHDIKTILSITFYAYIIPILLILFLLGVTYFASIIPTISISENDQTIVNYGYLGSFISGTLGIIFTAGSLIFLAKTLNFERKKSDQDNFDNKFFLMLETLEKIKDKIDDDLKNKILGEIERINEFSIIKTLEESKKIIHMYNTDIGHYFRMLYQIVKMVDQNEDKILNFRNVKTTYYTNILRSTLDFKLTQILAINVYYSDDFDSEYKEYSIYTKKYNFFEHMPFCISKNHISESLLAVYLNCDQGFGDSSFVKKMNKYVINSIKTSILCKYNYDLKYSFLKRLVGEWQINKFFLKISIKERLVKCNIEGRNWDGELINTYPDTANLIKCEIYSHGQGYDISSYFDEELNFNLIFDESAYEQFSNLNDIRKIKIKLFLKNMNVLYIMYIDESIVDGDDNYIQPLTKAIKLN